MKRWWRREKRNGDHGDGLEVVALRVISPLWVGGFIYKRAELTRV